MSSSDVDDSTVQSVLPPSQGRKFSQDGSRPEQTLSDVQSTPLSNYAPTGDPTNKAAYFVGHYDRYIEEDFRGRVLVHAEHFFPEILHIRPDWRMDDEMTKNIQTIRDNPAFQQHMQTYIALCNKTNSGEMPFYHPYSGMCKNSFDVLGVTDDPGRGIYRQDRKPVLGSEEQNIPDTLGVLRAMFESSGNDVDQIKDNRPKSNSSRVQHWQEFETKVSMLDEGTEVTYGVLASDDKDPREKVQVKKKTVHRDPGSILAPDRSSQAAPTSKKRGSENEHPNVHSKYARSGATPDVSDARKGQENSTALDSLREGILGLDGPTMEEDEQRPFRDGMLKCGRYALEILSSAGFRTHCIGALVTKGCTQLLHYDRSVIVVFKPIEMFKSVKPSESTTATKTNTDTNTDTNTTVITDEFSALLVGLGRLTLKQQGIQEQFRTDRHLVENYKTYMERCGKVGNVFDQRDIFKGVKPPYAFKLKTIKGDEEVEVSSVRLISRQPAIIGRHTCVVETKSDYMEWKGKEVVIKISWPAAERHSEVDLVQTDREKGRTMKTGRKTDWALVHLPDILRCQDFAYDETSTQANIAPFFKKVKCAGNKAINYEHRVCRITVQERLYPLSDLRTVEDYAQVFFDILQVHKWLYDHPRILHRDISPGNIKWRRTIDGYIRGILNDFDLSSLRTSTRPSSAQRTGTLPYMAFQLLAKGDSPKHLYRHDIESIFYVILLLACCYEFVPIPDSEPKIDELQKVNSEFDAWFKLDREALNDKKVNFFLGDDPTPTVNDGCSGFQPWVSGLHKQFIKGLTSRKLYKMVHKEGDEDEFDDETLQDWVSFSSIVETCAKFAGASLVIRNDQLEVPV